MTIAEVLPQNSGSAILRFIAENPNATPAQIEAWTDEQTEATCLCGASLRRFERWNGECERCRVAGLSKNQSAGHEYERLKRVGVPDVYLVCSFANWEGGYPAALNGEGEPHPKTHGFVDWSKNPGNFAVLMGPTGTGKTHLATAALADCLNRGYTCQWHNTRVLPDQLGRDSYDNPRLFKRVTECELLVLDDVGSERASEYVDDRIGTVLELRYQKMLPTLITTNLSAQQLYAKEPRLAGRILSNVVFRLAGRNRRIAR